MPYLQYTIERLHKYITSVAIVCLTTGSWPFLRAKIIQAFILWKGVCSLYKGI